jgi:glucose/arabinose dehydrogenase
MPLRPLSLMIFLFLSFWNVAHGQSPSAPTAIRLDPYISGLTFTVFVTNAGDGSNRLFIIQKAGIILVVQPGSTTPTTFLNITSRVRASGNEQGLLGLAFHPSYRTNGRFFVYYTRTEDGAIQIAEYRVSAGNANVADTTEKILLTIPHPGETNHNGGTVAFGMDGYLYAGTGDGGSANDPSNNAQNINVLLGKMLRIDINNVPVGQVPQYNIPPDNPYVGRDGADEIYAVGLRNPYRFSFDNGKQRGTQARHRLWVADVGQGSIEEVDLVQRGGNYGWRAYEGTQCTGLNPQQCTGGTAPIVHDPPIFQYSHSNGRCSITGGQVYRGSTGVFPRGNYIYADYCTGEIFMWNGSTQTMVLDTPRLIVAIGSDEAGELYVVGQSGTVEKIAGTAAQPELETAFSEPAVRRVRRARP